MNRHIPLFFLAVLAPLPTIAAITCSVSVGTLAFGTYAGLQTQSSATLNIVCSQSGGSAGDVNYSAKLSTGTSGNFAQRRMTRMSGTDTLNYNLYLSSVPGVLNTRVWGDGTGGTIFPNGTLHVPASGKDYTQTYTVAGAIPAGPLPTIGDYVDIIFVMVTYN